MKYNFFLRKDGMQLLDFVLCQKHVCPKDPLQFFSSLLMVDYYREVLLETSFFLVSFLLHYISNNLILGIAKDCHFYKSTQNETIGFTPSVTTNLIPLFTFSH